MEGVFFVFDHVSKIYFPGDEVKGKLIFGKMEPMRYKAVQFSANCVEYVESDGLGIEYGTELENGRNLWQMILRTDSLPPVVDGSTSLDFSFTLPKDGRIIESFKTNHVAVRYFLEFVVKTSIFTPDIVGRDEFFVGSRKQEIALESKSLDIIMKTVAPEIFIQVCVDSNTVSQKNPLTGTIAVLKAAQPIRSIKIGFQSDELLFPNKLFIEKHTKVSKLEVIRGTPVLDTPIRFSLDWPYPCLGRFLDDPSYQITFSCYVVLKTEKKQKTLQIIPINIQNAPIF